MIADDLDTALGVLAKHAGDLRKAGVRELTVGDVHVTIAPPDAPLDAGATKSDRPANLDPLNDPDTYGFTDGRVPGFTRDEEQQT